MHGLILAGGTARRMGGGDKPLLPFGGGVLLDAVVARVAPQVEALAISANGDPARFGRWGLPVLADEQPGLGPLGGILAGLRWAAAAGADWLLTVPGDTPFPPIDLAKRLEQSEGSVRFAASGERDHPAVAMVATRLADDLQQALADGIRAVRHWTGLHQATCVVWDMAAGDPFANVNTPEDLAAVARRLAEEALGCRLRSGAPWAAGR